LWPPLIHKFTSMSQVILGVISSGRRKETSLCGGGCRGDSGGSEYEIVARDDRRVLLKQDVVDVVGISWTGNSVSQNLKNVFHALSVINVDVGGIVVAGVALALKS